MQYRRSFRHHFVIFVLLSFIALAQLSWWVIFQLNEGSRVTKLQHRIWTEQIRVASEQAGLWSERPRHELETWLQRVFPDLTLEEASGKIIVSAAAEKRLRRLAGGRVRMYVSEGAFFIFLLLTGIGYMYWVLRREILYEQQQSSFLSATSHELKTPITSLRLHLDTLIDRDLPKAQALDVLSTMRRDLDRLTDQIDRQLQAQAFVFGKRKLSLQPTDLTDETQFILKEISGRYNLKDLQLRTHLEPDVTVMADPERWQILVRNLLENAIKYSPGGGVLQVSLTRAGRLAQLHVSDEGVGFSQVECERIFERFYRIESEETRRTHGTGLGLYLVREIARSFGGSVRASSEGKGKGAAFIVEIPLAEEKRLA